MKKFSFKFLSSIAIILFSLFFAIPSLIDIDSNLPSWMSKNKLKLGLDLQGGSQLLLQVETEKAILEKIQTQVEDIRTALLNIELQPEYIRLIKDTISIKVDKEDIDQFMKNKEGEIVMINKVKYKVEEDELVQVSKKIKIRH